MQTTNVTRDEILQTGRTEGNADSGKDRLLDILKANSKTNGWLSKSFTTDSLAREIGLNEHELVHLLHSLKKEHLVTFREGHNKQPIRIRLTPMALGKDYAAKKRYSHEKLPGENKFAHKGKFSDDVIARLKHDRARGGPGGRGMTLKELGEKYDRSVPVILEHVRGIEPENMPPYMAARQKKKWADRGNQLLDEVMTQEAPSPVQKAIDEYLGKQAKSQGVEIRDVNPFIEPYPTWQEAITFPLIETLAKRRDILMEASKLAEQGGADDIALALIEKAETPMSALEQEAVTLFNLYRRR